MKNKRNKSQYNLPFSCAESDTQYKMYPNVKSSCHKAFSLKQERSFFLMHSIEYREYNLKLRQKRSANNLPDPWDDYPSYVYKNAKSWKQGTKRSNQYYKEKGFYVEK